MENRNRLTVVCQNCLSYFIHKEYKWEYLTPFVDLWISPENYLRLLSKFSIANLRNLRLVDRYLWSINGGENLGYENYYYPIVNIDDKAIVHGIHYNTYQEFIEKWNRRVERMNFQNMLFIYTDFSNIENRESKLQEFLEYTQFYNQLVITDQHLSEDINRRVVPKSLTDWDQKFYDDLIRNPEVKSFIQELKSEPLSNRIG